MLKEVFIVTCIFMQISLSYQRRLDTDFEIKSANTNSSIAVCSGSLSTSFCAVARCPKFINITVNPRCVIEIKMPPQKRCQNWTFSWTMKKAVGRCILEIICDSIHGKVKTALCSCSCFAEPAVDDLSTIALSTEMAATISASTVTTIHSNINKTAPVVYSTIKTLKSTSDMAAFLPQMTTAASTAAVTNYASSKTTTEVTFAKATEITSTLPVFATMAKNSTATTTSYLQDLENILVKMKKMMSCSCSETNNGIDCQKCRKGKRKLIANQLREFENVLKNTSLQLIDTGNRIASTEHVQLIALREHCLNSSFSYGVAEIPLNEYEVTCNYSTQSNKLINGCLDYVVITAEVYIDSSIMSYLKDDPEQENYWSSHETHYIVPQSIPYLSVSTVEIRALNKLNGSVRYQLNSSIAKVVQDQVVPYVYHNPQGKHIYVKDITVSCDFIDERESEFSTFGCKRVDHNKFGPVVCECNHTTVFAILLSVESVAVPAGVKLCSYITESISLIFLSLTITILYCNKSRIDSDRTLIQLNLSVSLFCFHIINLFHDLAVENDAACITIAIGVHFFLLSTAMWMLAEGLRLFMKTSDHVLSYNTIQSRQIAIVNHLIGWGIPALFTSISSIVGLALDVYMKPCYLFVEEEEYRNSAMYEPKYETWVPKYDICWLDPGTEIFWVGVVIPVLTALFLNVIIAIKVTVSITKIKKRTMKLTLPCEKKKQSNSNVNSLLTTLRTMVMLLTVLGTSWVLGFLTGIQNHEASVIMMYTNVVVNGLQGVFVYILYCRFNPGLRRKIYHHENQSTYRLRKRTTSSISSASTISFDVTRSH